jgi:flagellar protein FlaI
MARKHEEKPHDNYNLLVNDVQANISIFLAEDDYVPTYEIIIPIVKDATEAALDSIREELLDKLDLRPAEIISPEEMKLLKKKFKDKAVEIVQREFPNLKRENYETLVGLLLQQSLGLGIIEFLLMDKNLEEIVINSSKDPVWVYHIKKGWLKTNILISDENQIYDYAASIGRRVGEQITNLKPLMDAYLPSGDRTNATLFPISSGGNTITIRKFARRPWTITDFIQQKTLSLDMAAFLWLAIQYEMNVVIAGGTASGKTSLLNSLTCFIPPNHRVLSIEDTREIQLPKYLHWVPLTTRPPNPEGKGEVSMLHILINSLRMRPDRIIVGEIRRSREAEVLFEAINTGHSVYSTLHANTAEEAFRRLVNPPINIPIALLGGLQLVAVMHRDRRKNVRRVLQLTELIPSSGLREMKIDLNTIYQWVAAEDKVIPLAKSYRAMSDIKLYTGFTEKGIEDNLEEKKKILEYLAKKNINDINMVGKIVSDYYKDRQKVLSEVASGKLKVT